MRNFYKKWKSLVLLSFLFSATFSSLQAQVSAYLFEQSLGSYTELTGGTQVFTGTTDDAISASLPLGFNFVYNGVTYTTIKVNANGWASFGTTTSTGIYTPLTTTGTHNPCLAPLGRDLRGNATGQIRVETQGVAPNRVFVINWINYSRYFFGTTGTQNFNFQIQLSETSNLVRFVYGTMTAATSSSDYDCGITGASNADFNSRTTTSSWASTTAGATNAANMTISPTVFPASGTTFLWGVAPQVPPTPTQSAGIPSCATGTELDLVGTPPADVVWYWQTSPLGTSTAEPYTGPYTVLSNNTYYARAYNTVSGLWSSTSSSIVVSNFPSATPPPAPQAAANPACFPGTEITLSGTPGVDIAWYWQGTNEFGTSTALDASVPFSVTSSGTYYAAAFDASTSCWSVGVGTAVAVNSLIPNAPAPVQASYAYCGSASPMDIQIEVPAQTPCNLSASGSGPDNALVVQLNNFSCITGNVQSATLNAAYTGTFCGSWYNYDIIVNGVEVASAQCNQTGFDLTPYLPLTSVQIVSNDIDNFIDQVTINLSINVVQVYPDNYEWYSAAVGGDFLGTGPTLNALGTTVLPVSANGTYEFFASSFLGGCESATRTLVEVIVTEVSVALVPVNETCINYADGSFTLGTVLCGDAPFEYSIDGGAFDAAIPADLAGGTYSVVVRDILGSESAPVLVVISTVGTVTPSSPTATSPVYYCATAASMPVEVDAVNQTPCNLSASGSGPDNALVVQINNFSCITGTVQSATLNAAYTGPFCGSWYNYDIIVNGVEVATAQCNQTGFDLMPYLPLISVQIVSNDIDNFIDPVTINISISVAQVYPDSYAWFDSNVNGNFLGNSTVLETIGTPVMPVAQTGVYSYFVSAILNGCYSDSLEVVVNVADVNVSLTPIPASCNNGASGSFILTNTECGDAPFTFSVDGGAFGPIPSNLVPGQHTVVVLDANGGESAEYTIVVPNAAPPSDLLIVQALVDGAEVSWTAGALETQWTVEWGLPGFVPGTGNEIGSATVNTLNYIITGLDDNEQYDVYVSANCGAGSTPGVWVDNTFLTLCGPIQGLFFCEDFSSTSLTEACWTVLNENGDLDAWDLNYTINPFAGDQVAMINTDFNGGNNDDWLISPNLTLTGNEVLNFYYRVQSAFEPNDFQVLLSTTGTNPADFTDTLMFLASYDNTTYQDTTVNLSAYSGNVYIAWHVPSGGLDGWRLYIDQVCIDVCIPPAGIDGSVVVCRLDELTNLNDIVVKGQEENGYWSFPSNEALIVNDTLFNVNLVPSGSYDVLWVVVGGCINDTTVATITVFPASTAGNDGTVVACRNQPINLFDGLSGTVDLGGVWYNPSNVPLTGAITTTSNIPGSFNFLYITSNGICPADTSLVEVIVDGTCDHLSLGSEDFTEMTVFPNPATDVLNINVSSNTGVMKIEMSDINGRIVLADASALANSESATLSIAHLEKGVYTLRIFSIEGQRTFKIVKH